MSYWYFRRGKGGTVELQARVTGEGGMIGDMRDQLSKDWKGRGTSTAELRKAAPGVLIEEAGSWRVLTREEARRLEHR